MIKNGNKYLVTFDDFIVAPNGQQQSKRTVEEVREYIEDLPSPIGIDERFLKGFNFAKECSLSFIDSPKETKEVANHE